MFFFVWQKKEFVNENQACCVKKFLIMRFAACWRRCQPPGSWQPPCHTQPAPAPGSPEVRPGGAQPWRTVWL